MSHSTGDRVDPVLRLRSSRLPSTILPCPCLQSQERVRIELDQMSAWGARALVFLLSSKLVVLGQSTYFEILSPRSLIVFPSIPSHQSAWRWQPHCVFLPAVTGIPITVVKRGQSRRCQGASSLSLSAEPQLGWAPSSVGATWTLWVIRQGSCLPSPSCGGSTSLFGYMCLPQEKVLIIC